MDLHIPDDVSEMASIKSEDGMFLFLPYDFGYACTCLTSETSGLPVDIYAYTKTYPEIPYHSFYIIGKVLLLHSTVDNLVFYRYGYVGMFLAM